MWNYEKRLEYPINIKRTDASIPTSVSTPITGRYGMEKRWER